jgi:hypothetical protein
MSGPEPNYATSAAVAGLAREIEGLRRAVDSAAAVPQQVADLAAVVADLVIAVEQLTAIPAVMPPVCWLDFADTPTEAFAVLGKLAAWLSGIYLRYTDAALPDCWLWHPDVVEELLWLSQAWQAAYAGPRSSIAAVGDWHDRQRSGVSRRIATVARSCSIETHQTDGGGGPTAPMTDALDAIATWWANHRTGPAPAPTVEQLAAVTTKGGRR